MSEIQVKHFEDGIEVQTSISKHAFIIDEEYDSNIELYRVEAMVPFVEEIRNKNNIVETLMGAKERTFFVSEEVLSKLKVDLE